MNNPTIIQNPIYINGKDDNGCQYPNIDIRYGPYNSINEAINILTENNWFIPFLTIGIKDNNIIKEYWVDENKNLVDKLLNEIIDLDETKLSIVDYIDKEIKSTNEKIKNINNDLKKYKSDIDELFSSIKSGIPNDIKNCLNLIDINRADINKILIELNNCKDNIKENFEKNNNYYNDINKKLQDNYSNIRYSIKNINVVLETITEENKILKENYNNIFGNIKNNTESIINIEKSNNDLDLKINDINKNIKQINIDNNNILTKFKEISNISNDCKKTINNFNIKIDNLINNLSTKIQIVKINNIDNFIELTKNENTINCLLNLNKHYILNINDDNIDDINISIPDIDIDYDCDFIITIIGNKSYNVENINFYFNNNIKPIIFKNSVTTIKINSITKIATYTQINK